MQGWEEVRLQGFLSRVIGLSESMGSCKEAHYPQLCSVVLPVSTVELSHVCAQAGVHKEVSMCRHANMGTQTHAHVTCPWMHTWACTVAQSVLPCWFRDIWGIFLKPRTSEARLV